MKEKSSGKRALKIIIIVSVLLIYGFGIYNAYLFTSTFDVGSVLANAPGTEKEELIKSYIKNYFYEDVDAAALDEGAFRGIVDSLGDKYSQYFTASEYEQFTINTNATFSGIGAGLVKDEDTGEVIIRTVYDDTPASDTGLKAGDVIVSADGQLGISMDLDSFVHLLRGPEGTSFEMVYRRGADEHTATITRRKVIIPSVYYNMLWDNIGYVQITSFAENTDTEFKKAIDDLSSQGAKGLIYDIRSNPGGLVSSVVNMLDMLLPEGTVVYTMDKNNHREDYTSDEENRLDLPCVVLVDEYSASASEIFAGAIRDFEYGTIIGTTTTGKGVIQNLISLPDGSGLKLTVAEYFTPSGTAINKVGIIPDTELEYNYNYSNQEDEEYEFARDNQVVTAVEILKSGH